jgi:hypothetical protein
VKPTAIELEVEVEQVVEQEAEVLLFFLTARCHISGRTLEFANVWPQRLFCIKGSQGDKFR